MDGIEHPVENGQLPVAATERGPAALTHG